MIRSLGRAQMIGIAAILAFFFITQFAVRDGFDTPFEQSQASRH